MLLACWTALLLSSATETAPPIPIRFSLAVPGYVTLVIEDADGRRVRNLISDTRFPAGEQVVGWDGLDDVGRTLSPRNTGTIVGRMAEPGTYRVRGLVRPELELRYQFSPYNPGHPPWPTTDRSSGWLADHNPPGAVLFVPEATAPRREGHPAPGGQILVGTYVVEHGSGLTWLDLDGRKLHGQKWLGGVWTAASHLARDAGPDAVPGVYAYAAAAWEGGGYDGDTPELRLAELLPPRDKGAPPRDERFGVGEDRPLLRPRDPIDALFPSGQEGLDLPEGDQRFAFPDNAHVGVSGLAVHNALLVAALPKLNQLLFVDARARRILGTAPLADPRGLAFDAQGRLLALSGNRLVRFEPPNRNAVTEATAQPQVVTQGLDDPQRLALDAAGNVYISQWGRSHQVQVIDPDGRRLRTIGRPGPPRVGPYDPLHLNHPAGLAIDGRGRLWVAEHDFRPKRVSVWSLDGRLLNAFYGPHRYGGGGTLDGADRSRFFYDGMELRLNWEQGTSEPVAILYRETADALAYAPAGHQRPPAPETPFHVNGRLYLTNTYTTHPTNGTWFAVLWLEREGRAVPVAATGLANEWPKFREPEFAATLPQGIDLARERVTVFWQDRNGDGQMQPDEIHAERGDSGPVIVTPELAFVTGRAVRYQPLGFEPDGRPRYHFGQGETLVPGTRLPITSGGGQVYPADHRWTILTVPPEPYPVQTSVAGAKDGVPVWTYPSLWPGLHPSHDAPLPQHPGQLIGTTRLLGPPIKGGEVGQLWALNGDKGNVYLFTTDGLFVSTLFRDSRQASWNAPEAVRGMLVNDLSPMQEAFYPTISQTPDGRVFLVVGFDGNLVELTGLEGIRRLAPWTVEVTTDDVQRALAWQTAEAARRQAAEGPKVLDVALREQAPAVDGNLDDWADASWVRIDSRAEAALAVAVDRLYVAYRTADADLLRNQPEAPATLFKTGGGLDLMVGPAADPERRQPVAGHAVQRPAGGGALSARGSPRRRAVPVHVHLAGAHAGL